MSASWEVQKALYDAMVADTTLTSLVSTSNIIGYESEVNQTYPFIKIGQMTEIPDNRHGLLGYEVTHTMHINTKPYGLGFYTAEQILEEMNRILNMKRFTLPSYTMVICFFDNAITHFKGEVRIISVRYKVICHSNTRITY